MLLRFPKLARDKNIGNDEGSADFCGDWYIGCIESTANNVPESRRR